MPKPTEPQKQRWYESKCAGTPRKGQSEEETKKLVCVEREEIEWRCWTHFILPLFSAGIAKRNEARKQSKRFCDSDNLIWQINAFTDRCCLNSFSSTSFTPSAASLSLALPLFSFCLSHFPHSHPSLSRFLSLSSPFFYFLSGFLTFPWYISDICARDYIPPELQQHGWCMRKKPFDMLIISKWLEITKHSLVHFCFLSFSL